VVVERAKRAENAGLHERGVLEKLLPKLLPRAAFVPLGWMVCGGFQARTVIDRTVRATAGTSTPADSIVRRSDSGIVVSAIPPDARRSRRQGQTRSASISA
jgi:hypothetical protein